MTDSHDIDKIATRLASATKRLRALAPLVGSAKTVKSYDGDRRKHLLSVQVLKAYKDGATSSVEAEHRARASAEYQSGLDRLQGELESAEKTISEWDAENCAWDASRSLLSLAKSTMRELQG